MRSCLIGGAGRSGTSLAAGLFRKSGYFYGEKLWTGTISNPEGYFEDEEINAINEDLLEVVTPWRPKGLVGTLCPLFRDRTKWGQHWLAMLPTNLAVNAGRETATRIQAQVERQPFLFKDPLFSYTLPVWRPHLPEDTVFICMFREPTRTASSIMQICRKERYLWDLKMTLERANAYWAAIYSYILYNEAVSSAPWVFIHYDEILSGAVLPFLERTLEATVDHSILRPDLKRSPSSGPLTDECASLYAELCRRARSKYGASSEGLGKWG